MNAAKYNSKLNDILIDDSKFREINKDPTTKLKTRLNQLIVIANNFGNKYFASIRGHFSPGYLYANPKIHKSTLDPPMRPIISQVGTVTYDLAKSLCNIISPYMPRNFMIGSTYEFLEIARGTEDVKILSSLDVENLFTNVPVEETINIIIDCVYNHNEIKKPTIPQEILHELLHICTTETPFITPEGKLYTQVNGVSMGSALGPVFANYYMSNLENKMLPSFQSKHPITYCRYVDDIFVIAPNYAVLEELRLTLEKNSVLEFTFEIEKNKKLSFLDCLVTRDRGKLST